MDISPVSCTKQRVAQEAGGVKIDVTGPIAVAQDVELDMAERMQSGGIKCTAGVSVGKQAHNDIT